MSNLDSIFNQNHIEKDTKMQDLLFQDPISHRIKYKQPRQKSFDLLTRGLILNNGISKTITYRYSK